MMCAYEDCQQARILYGLSDLHKGWCLKVLVFLCECAYELIIDYLIAVSQFIHIGFFFSFCDQDCSGSSSHKSCKH